MTGIDPANIDPAVLAALLSAQKDGLPLKDLPTLARADQYVGWRHAAKGVILSNSSATDERTLE